MKAQINANIYNVQMNQFSNPLNLQVVKYDGFDNEMIDYGINIINKAYSLMNDLNQLAKYVTDSFNSKYPAKTKWNCFIIKKEAGSSFWEKKSIWFSMKDYYILIFLAS